MSWFEERDFLKGPQKRLSELFRAIRIFLECIRGFRALHFVGPCVTVYGSARYKEDHPYYDLTRIVSAEVSKKGFTIMTGGGPGLMEAANRGARDVGGKTIGCNIILPHEQVHNAYLDQVIEFNYFFVRKLMLAKYSYAFIAMPGGFGTLDELFEVLTLIQTGKMKNFTVVLMGIEYWKHLIDFMNKMIAEKTIAPVDVTRLIITDNPVEAAEAIATSAASEFGVRLKPPSRSKLLLE